MRCDECLGQNVWHDGTRFASLQMLNSQTCVLITDDEDVRGYLSSDGQVIEWEDGDRWSRTEKALEKAEVIRETELEPWAEVKEMATEEEAVLDVLLSRNGELLKRLKVEQMVNPSRLWPEIGWTPDGEQEVPTPLIVAAMLLQWPEAGGFNVLQHVGDILRWLIR